MKENKLLSLMLLLIFVSGCANKPKGPVFETYTTINEQSALVYVYRPLGESLGHARTYYLKDEMGMISDLKHGGYIPFEVEPGKITLVADVNESVMMHAGGMYLIELATRDDAALLEFEAIAGNVYYVRFKPIAHFTYFEPTLTLLTEDESLDDLQKCRLIIR